MPTATDVSGACLCGAVKFSATAIEPEVGACHCGSCRKWTGGPLMTVDCGSEVKFEGEENISVYNSSEWAERGFCKQCGSSLFYRLKGNSNHFMMAGLFDDNSSFDFNHQVFIDEKPAYYGFANKTREMTGEQVFAYFTAGS